MLVGYARVSTQEQNLARQIDALLEAGVDRRCMYCDRMTGTTKDRPELNRMISELEAGDVVLICDLTRISRSTRDLLDIVDTIRKKGAGVKSLKDTWLDTTNDNPYGSFLLSVMAGLAQLERDLIAQRTREGLEAAKRRGRVGGRPSKQSEHKIAVCAMGSAGMGIVDICKQTGLSRSTVRRILQAEENQGKEVI